MKKIITDNWFKVILLSFIVRLVFAFLPSFDVDMGAWIFWSHRLSKGIVNFYSDDIWTQYTPGFLYWLFVIGKFNLVNKISILLPVIMADIITGFLIANLANKKAVQKIIFLIYVLNPAVIFVGSVWGQIDGLLSLFLFLVIYFLFKQKNIYYSSFFLAIALLIKPQAILLIPTFCFVGFKNFGFKKLFLSIFFNLFLLIIFAFPFFMHNPIFGLFEKILTMSSDYKFTSLFAYNIWLFITGMWKNDQNFQIISLFISLMFTFLVFLPFLFLKKINIKQAYYFGFMSSFIFFLFPTRVHERYLFPLLPLMLSYVVLQRNYFKYIIFWLGLSILFLLNVYYAYSFYSNNFLKNIFLMSVIDNVKYLIALFFISIFFYFLLNSYIKLFNNLKFKNLKKISPIIFILIFAFFTRVYSLNKPNNFYFDEIYHAFTAQRMIAHDAHAWDWRGVHPKGFAYEWTHPPLAKEIMAFSMIIFNQNPFYWRLPAALLGTFCVYLVYLIAKNLYGEKVGITSGLIFALDGLPLVLSRIGMNDIYFLFFALCAIYFIIKDKYLFSSVFYGLSLSSKWSALWLAPIIFVIFLTKNKKTVKFSYFLFIPLTVYFLSYVPMFFEGHNIITFIGLQKQMWWYHTRLDATHPFSSPWWSWPFLIRPIWFYTSGTVNFRISNIYGMGNPIVFWFGLASIFYLVCLNLFQKNKKQGLILFSYFVFFTPWALSPRIMFIYHYLPSIPFLAIAIAIVLEKHKKIKPYYLLLAFVAFIYFYPRFVGISVPVFLNDSYRWLPSW